MEEVHYRSRFWIRDQYTAGLHAQSRQRGFRVSKPEWHSRGNSTNIFSIINPLYLTKRRKMQVHFTTTSSGAQRSSAADPSQPKTSEEQLVGQPSTAQSESEAKRGKIRVAKQSLPPKRRPCRNERKCAIYIEERGITHADAGKREASAKTRTSKV